MVFNFRSSIADFPSMTICPDYTVAYKTDVLAKYNVTDSDIRKFRFPKLKNLTSLEFYRMVTFELNEVLKDMFIGCAYKIKGSEVNSFYLTEKWLTGDHPSEIFHDDIMYLNYR